jgi:predicted AAA+ superfamily ATPase
LPGAPAGRLPKAARSALDKNLLAYMQGGGFPEAQGVAMRDRIDLLRGYVDVALLRDVMERHAVTQPTALRWMVRQLLGNAAGFFSVNKFHRDIKSQGFAIGKDTLHEYLAYLEDAFLIRTIALAADSERRRMVNPRKVYPIDPGLIPVFDRSGRANLGHALETCVLLALERRGGEIAYVRTERGFEVDFLVTPPGGREELIQVCTDLEDRATRERETRALLDAAQEHPRASLQIITLHPGPASDLPKGVTVHRAADWLLAEASAPSRT